MEYNILLGGPSIGLSLNHWLFRIWQYLCHILSPLNMTNPFTLEQHRDLLGQLDFVRWCRSSSFRMKLIFTSVGTLRNKHAVFGTEETCGLINDCLMRLVDRSMISSYFFENEDGATITINRGTYCSKITDFFVSALHVIDTNDVWFQQNDPACHKSHTTTDL